MSLAEVSRATRISTTALERIEADHFDDLPGEVFTRGFLKAYAATVGLSPNEVLARYTAARRSVAVEPLPLATPVTRSGARRFGFAVAFVVLVVLFTLALSMVLRPRGHDRPPELSRLDGLHHVGLHHVGLHHVGLHHVGLHHVEQHADGLQAIRSQASSATVARRA